MKIIKSNMIKKIIIVIIEYKKKWIYGSFLRQNSFKYQLSISNSMLLKNGIELAYFFSNLPIFCKIVSTLHRESSAK